jgi:hypothetical protein
MKIAIGAVLSAILLLGCGGDSSGNDVADVVDLVEATDDAAGADADADADGDAEDDGEVEAEVEACVPESDDDFCTRLSVTCGEVTADDNCGDERTVASCGTCDDGDPCTADSCDLGTRACTTAPVDADGDTYPAAQVGGTTCSGGTDCNDGAPAINPGALPVACSDLDNDCNGHPDNDADGDTHVDIRCTGGDDCNDSDASVWSGAWYDTTTGYLWENPPSDTARNWDDAVAYCDGLTVCGNPSGAWHLPTISESRSFIRGCVGTVTGGACGVTDTCLGSVCYSSSCYSCSSLGGPGAGGCYWAPGVSGRCSGYWSSSSYAGGASNAWVVSFYSGYVDNYGKTNTGFVRCVRRGP